MEWRNREDIRTRTREHRILTMADQERWFESISQPSSVNKMFVVCVPHETHSKSFRAIGVVGLCDWSPRDRTAEISFYIGDESCRGQGYCREALEVLIAWGFGELDLAQIWAESYDFNVPGIALMESLGFVRTGELPDHVYRMGRRHSSYFFALQSSRYRTAA